MTPEFSVHQMTETELHNEAEKLRKLAREGEMTAAQADRLVAIQIALRRISAAKRGDCW